MLRHPWFVVSCLILMTAPAAGRPSSTDAGGGGAVHMESRDLAVEINPRGAMTVRQKACGAVWHPDPWEETACRVVCSGGGSRIWTVDFRKAEDVRIESGENGQLLTFSTDTQVGSVTVSASIALDGSHLRIGVRDVHLPENTRLVSVQYPFRSFYLKTGKDEGYLALPTGEGSLIPTGPVRLGTTAFWAWHDQARSPASHRVENNPTMPFYGAQKNGAGYTAIVETTDDFGFEYLLNCDGQYLFDAKARQSPYPQIACAWPVWLAQKGRLGYERRLRLEFADSLDYVGMAKAYRREALRVGDLVTLREKAKVRPQVARLAGAPYLAYYAGYPHLPPGTPGMTYRYDDLRKIVEDLAGPMRLRRAFVHFWGAYTVQPPGCLPFDTAPGTVGELAGVVRQAKEAGFLFTLYNDVSAQLEETDLWMPTRMWQNEDGGRSGPWGRWRRTCSSQYVELLARHLPEVVSTLGVEAAYVDCVNGGAGTECYDPAHPLTRGEERKARQALYRYIHSLGLVYGGEHAGWWNAADLEYTNGVGHWAGTPALLRSFPVPLYHLVFHDALVAFCHAGDDYTTANGTCFEDKVLRDLLRGVPPMFFMNLADHGKWRNKITECSRVMAEPTAAVFYDEMLSHRFVTPDQMVQQTRFSSGVEVKINLDEVSREGLPAKSYRVTGMAGGPRSGAFQLRCVRPD